MNCEQLWKVLPDFLDEEMKQELCAELHEHIKTCEYCRAHVHTMQTTIQLSHEMKTGIPKHDEYVARLRERLLGGKPPADD